jgi:hypothetical protein
LQLPTGTEPLVLADGTKINPVDGRPVQEEEVVVEVPNTATLQREVTAARMRISDLPMPPQQMNSLSVILSYSLQGVTDEDIGILLHVSTEQINNIKASDAYKELQETIVKNIVESDSSNIRGLFVQKSEKAAKTMFGLMDSEIETTQMAAAKDVLDRAGQRPVDVVEHRHHMEGGLTIKYVEEAKDEVPPITINADEF